MDYKRMSQKERDVALMAQLTAEKQRFLQKYDLHSTPEQNWCCSRNNTPQRLYFSQRFLLRADMLAIVFRKYQLCRAKLRYFRENLDCYDFWRHTPTSGFVSTELWDAAFFRHKKSCVQIDLRHLQSITVLSEFHALVGWLENDTTN